MGYNYYVVNKYVNAINVMHQKLLSMASSYYTVKQNLIKIAANTKVNLSSKENEKLKKLIPDNTQLLNTSLEKECLTVDFSNELLNYNKNNQNEKENMVKSIVNTLTELTEVNKVKILINGQVNEEFKDEYVRK